MNKIKTPTGFLFIDQYEKGDLETLSIGDYGKSKNIKADFLGYDREINGVANGEIMPLQEKWVITLSTQYGCVMKCNFCDVPNVKFRGNVSFEDLKRQLYSAIKCYPEVTYTDRLNIHFARMGEPTYNGDVLGFAEWLSENKLQMQQETGVRFEVIHPVFTTMMPDRVQSGVVVRRWVDIKNKKFNGQAGLQISINSSSNNQRSDMFGEGAMSIEDIAMEFDDLPEPLGRKYCLNIAYADGNIVDGEYLAKLFDTSKWMIKITPIHNNNATKKSGLKTVDGYSDFAPYRNAEKSCKNAGFDVLVFIPSKDEEDYLITCGNAILGGSKIK